jgi:hypothetical protein
MKSGAILPFENLPVAIPFGKSLPYGAKLLFAIVGIKLLLPESTDESPKTIIAGTFPQFDFEKFNKISIQKSHIILYILLIFPWSYQIDYVPGNDTEDVCNRLNMILS